MRLSESGVSTRHDAEQGWEEYRAQREEWESKLRRPAVHLGYVWEEVTGDRDLEYASDEGKAEPVGGRRSPAAFGFPGGAGVK